MKKEEEFIYCKDCKYFPRWRLYGKRLATCKAHNKDRELAFYSPEYINIPTHYKFCNVQNYNNDCHFYEKKK